MRRIYAIILLIPVLALFTGSVTLASVCGKMETSCGVAPSAPSQQVCHGCCGGKCNNEQTSRGSQKGKTSTTCCADCPLCCLVTFKPFFHWEVIRQATTIDYMVMSDNNLSDYFQQHWKPPNAATLS